MHWLDPDFLPEISGTFERFLINPHGDADGMILSDGTEVHFPPHLSAELRAALKGDRPVVKVRGVRPRGCDLVAAVAIETMDGRRIVDNGPREKHGKEERPKKHSAKPKHSPMLTAGTIRRVLHGPRGELRGALLDNGTIVRVRPHEAHCISHLLSPGRWIEVRGGGLSSELGTVIEVREIHSSGDEAEALKPRKPKHAKPSGPPVDTPAR